MVEQAPVRVMVSVVSLAGRQDDLTSGLPDVHAGVMTTPDSVERQFTFLTAAARFEQLRTRDALAPATGEPAGPEGGFAEVAPLSREEALELLALGEVIARKASYGRQLTVRTARATGASWAQIGAALGTTKQSAWEGHARWLEGQVEQHQRSDYEGPDQDPAEARAAAARALTSAPQWPGSD